MKSMLLYQKNVRVNISYQPFETSDLFIFKVAHLSDGFTHGLINYQDTKAKCRHLKNLSAKGLCGRCLSEFIDRDTVSNVGIFDPAL